MRKSVKSFFAIVLCLCVFAAQAFVAGAYSANDFAPVFTEGGTSLVTSGKFVVSGTTSFTTTMEDPSTQKVNLYGGAAEASEDGSYVRLYSRHETDPSNSTYRGFRFDVAYKAAVDKYKEELFLAKDDATDPANLKSDIVFEFDVKPNENVAYMSVGSRTTAWSSNIDNLSTSDWNHITVAYDCSEKVSHVWVNGVYRERRVMEPKYPTTGTVTDWALQTIRVQATVTQANANTLKNTDVYFDIKDFKLAKTVVTPGYDKYAEATNLSEFTTSTAPAYFTSSGRLTVSGATPSAANGMFGRDASDESYMGKISYAVSNGAALGSCWYGIGVNRSPIASPDMTKDIVCEFSIAPPESATAVKLQLFYFDLTNSAKAIGSKGIAVADVRLGEWNKVKVVYNCTDKKFSIYLNGKLKYENIELLTGSNAGKAYDYTGNIRITVESPAGTEGQTDIDRLYFDNFVLYQAPRDAEKTEEITSELPETLQVSPNWTVAEVKAKLDIDASDTVKVFADSTYTTTLSDTDKAVAGAVVVTHNSDDVFQYCKLEVPAKPEASLAVVKRARKDADGNVLEYSGNCSAKTPCTDKTLYTFETQITYKNLTGASVEAYAVIAFYGSSSIKIPDKVCMVPVTLEETNEEGKTVVSSFNNANYDHKNNGTHNWTQIKTFLVEKKDTLVPLGNASARRTWYDATNVKTVE